MKNRSVLMMLAMGVLWCGGCAPTVEVSKTVWGSSTRAVEKARVNAITKTFSCPYVDCFESVLGIAKDKHYEIFIKDWIKGTIVLMGVKGAINTTEVGIFFSELNKTEVKILISSLNSNAKRVVAQDVFPELETRFPVVPDEADAVPAAR